jgi:hypothetical protein
MCLAPCFSCCSFFYTFSFTSISGVAIGENTELKKKIPLLLALLTKFEALRNVTEVTWG